MEQDMKVAANNLIDAGAEGVVVVVFGPGDQLQTYGLGYVDDMTLAMGRLADQIREEMDDDGKFQPPLHIAGLGEFPS